MRGCPPGARRPRPDTPPSESPGTCSPGRRSRRRPDRTPPHRTCPTGRPVRPVQAKGSTCSLTTTTAVR
ncbi:hypothetical protein ADK52_31725 [Streptomyces sp. WM6372]|nr:hypothetical protein ADK52_31725 [Streptomyces sp. WM6372]